MIYEDIQEFENGVDISLRDRGEDVINVYPEISKFEPGMVVYLKSDLNRTKPMSVVDDHIKVSHEHKRFENATEYLTSTEMERRTGRLFKIRTVKTIWLNSQRKLEKGEFSPQLLSRLE